MTSTSPQVANRSPKAATSPTPATSPVPATWPSAWSATAAEFDSPAIRASVRAARAERRAARRTAWWYPPVVLGLFFCCLWGALRVDQYVADRFFWPSSGARFVEVGPVPADPESTGGTIVVVAGGLNRKSGTGPAQALLPALSADGARVFSLVYGNGISDTDIEDKFGALIDRTRPHQVDFFGSSMGGDVVLGLARHLQLVRTDHLRTDPDALPADARPIPAQVRAVRSAARTTPTGFARLTAGPTEPVPPTDGRPVPPRLGVIYLDCTPLGATDVRDVGRTRADAVTGLSEALHTDGGVGLRLTAEVLAQQSQWSTGQFPFVDVRWDDLAYKVDQVWRDKIDGPGISTGLVKDQYGVIRRMDIEAVARDLGADARIVYFRPAQAADDRVVRVGAAERTLRDLAGQFGLDVRIATIPDGHHAAAESNPAAYLAVLDAVRVSRAS